VFWWRHVTMLPAPFEGAMRKSSLSILIACTLWPAAPTPARSRLEADRTLSAPFPAELRAAPDGRRLAWFFKRQGVRDLWGGGLAGTNTAPDHVVF
jgi:hypothetical protein